MFKFKVRYTDPKSGISRTEEVHAENEKQIVEMSAAFGEKAEILGKEMATLDPRVKKARDEAAALSAQPVPGQFPPGMLPPGAPQNQSPAPPQPTQPTQPTPPVPPAALEFEEAGVKFKVVGSSVYKKTWVDCDASEYRVTRPSGKGMTDITERVTIQHLDWVQISGDNEGKE